jgi:hypothetical protein
MKERFLKYILGRILSVMTFPVVLTLTLLAGDRWYFLINNL